MLPKQTFGAPFKATAISAASAALCTVTAVSGQKHYITDISASSDTDGAIIQVLDGSTVIWQHTLGTVATGTNMIDRTFATPIWGTSGAAVSITVNGTSVGGAQSNIAGFTAE